MKLNDSGPDQCPSPALQPHFALDFCPRLRFVRAVGLSYVEDFRRARSRVEQQLAIDRACCLSHLLTQVITPLARDAQGPLVAKAYAEVAASLQSLAGPAPQLQDWNFPDDDGRQLVLDRLENIETLLREALKRGKRRHVVIIEEAVV